jgi:hypothetical protein
MYTNEYHLFHLKMLNLQEIVTNFFSLMGDIKETTEPEGTKIRKKETMLSQLQKLISVWIDDFTNNISISYIGNGLHEIKVILFLCLIPIKRIIPLLISLS